MVEIQFMSGTKQTLSLEGFYKLAPDRWNEITHLVIPVGECTWLPELPQVKKLLCCFNRLTQLPELPLDLEVAIFSHNLFPDHLTLPGHNRLAEIRKRLLSRKWGRVWRGKIRESGRSSW